MAGQFTIALVGAVSFGLMTAGTVEVRAAGDASKNPPPFSVCNATFALCTVAACDPVAEHPDQVSCRCTVNDGYSAGMETCSELKKTRFPNIKSRYYPVKVLAACTEERPWVFCLDKPCVINENDPRAASCTCSLMNTVPNPPANPPWVAGPPNTCTSGIISSATVEESNQITRFLGLPGNRHLRPFPIHWLPGPKPP